MELGTEDICLEGNRKPGSVVQRFGNDVGDSKTLGSALAAGMSAINSTNRRAIVKVRTGPQPAGDGGKKALPRTKSGAKLWNPSQQHALDQHRDVLESKLTLRGLQRLAPYFAAETRSTAKGGDATATKPPATMSGEHHGERSVVQSLMLLHRQCENEVWLHGTAPIAAAVKHSKAPPQFSHIRSSSPVRQSTAAESSRTAAGRKDLVPQNSPSHDKQRTSASGVLRDTASGDEDDDSNEVSVLDVSLRRASALQGGGEQQLRAQASLAIGDVLAHGRRDLAEDEFAVAVQAVVPNTTAAEAKCLFQKIDVESRGKLPWDDLLSYLVSRSTAESENPAIAQSTELMPVSVPRSCPSWYQHEKAICCVAVSPKSGTVFTGGCDGALRSWDGATLRHQKLWYTCNSWISGITLTHREQKLIICTVDRQLVVFDSKSGDVLRMYRGRRVLETENGINFAHESIPVVTVGGKVVSHAAPKSMRIRRMQRDLPKRDKDSDSGTKKAVTYEEFRAQIDEEKANQLEKRRLEEYILAGLVDAPACIEYHYSAQDEDVVFFGMDDGSIRLYILPVTQQRLLRKHCTLRLHSSRVRMMKVIPTLEGLVSCSDDGTLKLTSLESGQVIKSYGKGEVHENGVACFAYSSAMKMLISTGSDRFAVVWDQLQEAPIAKLDEHPCPTLCCCVNDAEHQFITIGIDNSVFVFDARSYRLQQQFHERIRSNNTHLSSTSGGYGLGMFDGPRQRLLLTTTFPVMHQLRRNVATLPPYYCGHTSPVVASLYSTTFDVLLTIDAEHLALGWRVHTGQSSGLSFYINSFASSHEDLRLTCASLDTLQRRLLTGFQNGTVVVWNVSNGQVLCVVRAVAPQLPPASPSAPHVGAAGAAAAGFQPSEVIAVTTLQRADSTHYIFSVGASLVTLKETPQFTVANPPRWPVPPELGVVTSLQPASPVLIACGTSSGAVFYFNIVLDAQDGLPLLLDDDTDSVSLSSVTPARRRDDKPAGGIGTVVSVFSMHRVKHTVLSLHADGRLLVWNSLRRLCVTTIHLAPPAATMMVVNAAIDASEEFLCVADDSGNLSVYALKFEPMLESRLPATRADSPRGENAEETSGSTEVLHSLQQPLARVAHFYGFTQTLTSVTLPRRDGDVIVATTASDFVCRVFDLHGHLVGELGMGAWDIHDKASYRFPDRAVSPMLAPLDVEGEAVSPGGAMALDRLASSPTHAEIPTTPVGGSPLRGTHGATPPLTYSLPLVLSTRRAHEAAALTPQQQFQPKPPPTPLSSPRAPGPQQQIGQNPQSRVRPQRAGIVKQMATNQGGRISISSDSGVPMSDALCQVSVSYAENCVEAQNPLDGSFLPNRSHRAKCSPTVSTANGAVATPPPAPLTDVVQSEVDSSVQPQVRDDQRRTKLLSSHLEQQLLKLRECKSDLNEELKRIEARLARKQDVAELEHHHHNHPAWTSRVAARLQLHDLEDIQPPAGSKASSEAGRRTQHRIKNLNAAGGARGGQRAVEFFPSVTAPGTVVIGKTDDAAEEEELP